MALIDYLDHMYTGIANKNPFLTRWRFYTMLRIIVRTFANFILPLQYRLTANNPKNRLTNTDKKEGRLIVSLTSFPARIGNLWMVIETIFRQRVKPDVIILWLSENQFPTIGDVPTSLLNLQERGLTIRIMPGDVRSHKKYCYCLEEFPDDHFVTIDDDVLYDTRMLERLMTLHNQYPKAVITNHAHRMTFTSDGSLRPYSEWEFHTYANDNLFFIGAGANLYPAHCLHPMASDIKTAYRLTPTGDDIWLNAMARLQGTPVVHGPYRFVEQLPVLNFHNVTLNATNVTSTNDVQIHALSNYLQETLGQNPFVEE